MKRAFISLALAIVALSASADKTIDLSDALRQARQSYPSLAGAKADINAAKARGSMLQVPYQPMIGFNAFASKGQGEMIFSSTTEPLSLTHMNADEQGTLNGMLMWRVFSFGRERVARRIADLDTGVSKQMLRTEEIELNMRVRLAYSQAMLRKDTLAARKAAVESAEEVLRTTQANVDNGKLPLAFVLRAKADVSAMKRELAMAEAETNMAMVSLKEAIGADQIASMELGSWDMPLLAPASMKEAIALARDKRTELSGLRRTQKSYTLRAQLAQLSSLPELSFTAMGDWMNSSGTGFDSSYRLGLVLSFPIGDGGERRAIRSEQKAMADKATADLKQMQLKIDAEVASAWSEWQAAPAVRQAAKDELQSAEEAYRIALLRYQEGKAILAEILDARSQLVSARLAQAESEGYTRRAWSMLQRAIGA